ncbi:hypothetical protein Trydic_g8375 [Trypoxylus dichotomus]
MGSKTRTVCDSYQAERIATSRTIKLLEPETGSKTTVIHDPGGDDHLDDRERTTRTFSIQRVHQTDELTFRKQRTLEKIYTEAICCSAFKSLGFFFELFSSDCAIKTVYVCLVHAKMEYAFIISYPHHTFLSLSISYYLKESKKDF